MPEAHVQLVPQIHGEYELKRQMPSQYPVGVLPVGCTDADLEPLPVDLPRCEKERIGIEIHLSLDALAYLVADDTKSHCVFRCIETLCKDDCLALRILATQETRTKLEYCLSRFARSDSRE